jgi:ribosomal-protein-serine acetyltransferase
MITRFTPLLAADLGDGLCLRQFEPADAEPLFGLIDRERHYLRAWLPWVDLTLAPNNAANFITMTLEQARQKNGFHCAIIVHHEIVGTIGLHSVDWSNRKTSLGYWLSSRHTGNGFMTRGVERIIAHCFDELGLHRIEIRCATENTKSRAIPRRLGFREEGVLRDNEWLNDHYVDHIVYGLLSTERRKII